jgi:hypothetical protein
MPYTIRKVRNKSCFMVFNRNSKRIFAKCTTKKRAEKQIRLLSAIENNKNFVPLVRTVHRLGNRTRKSRN